MNFIEFPDFEGWNMLEPLPEKVVVFGVNAVCQLTDVPQKAQIRGTLECTIHL